MPWPDDPFADPNPSPFVSGGLWQDEYRAAGGILVPEYLQRLRDTQDLYGGQQYEEPAPVQVPEQTYTPPEQFVDWPTYQSIVSDKLKPHEAYDEYLTVALPTQMRNMGYSEEEIAQAVNAFPNVVQPPAADYGWFGNLWEAAKKGYSAGNRELAASGYDVASKIGDVARLAVESAADQPTAQRIAFSQGAQAGKAEGGDTWDAIKSFISSAVSNPQGFIDEGVYQMAQSYPVMAAGLLGAISPVPGGAEAATATTSFALDAGGELLNNITTLAQQRGINVNDVNAIQSMLQEPGVYEKLRNAAAAHGVGVAATDAALASVSLGLGRVAARLARGGKTIRAGAVLGAEPIVGVVGEGTGEAIGTALAGRPYDPYDVVAESLSGAGTTVPLSIYGFVQERGDLQKLIPTQTPPGLLEGDLKVNLTEPEETPDTFVGPPERLIGPELPPFVGPIQGERFIGPNLPPASYYGPQQPPFMGPPAPEQIDIGLPPGPPQFEDVAAETPINVGPAELPTYDVAELGTIVDSAENRIREGRLLPAPQAPTLVPTPRGLANRQTAEQARLNQLATPQLATLQPEDRENVIGWLQMQGFIPTGSRYEAFDKRYGTTIDALATARPEERRDLIASVVEDLAGSPRVQDTRFAEGLLKLAATLPAERATRNEVQTSLEAALPGVPIAEVPSVVADELAQKVMTDLEAGVTNAPTESPSTIVAGSLLAHDTPTQSTRGLKRGESVPAAGGLGATVNSLLGRGAATSTEAPVQQPGSAVPAGVGQEGPVKGGRKRTLRNREAATAVGDTTGAGAQPNRPAGARGLSRVKEDIGPTVDVDEAAALQEKGDQVLAALPESERDVVRTDLNRMLDDVRAGVLPLAEANRRMNEVMQDLGIGLQLSTEPTVRQYGAQKTDVANKEAIAQQRADAAAKKATGGLSKKAKKAAAKAEKLSALANSSVPTAREAKAMGMSPEERQRQIAVVTMDKAEYEKTYPGRDYDADLDAIVKTGDARDISQESMHGIDDGTALNLQYKTATEIMNWLASVSPNPLARIIAREIAALDLPTKFILRDMGLAGAYVYDVDRGGKNDVVIINPRSGRTLETILHEFVHAATLHNYNNPRTKAHKEAVAQINDLYIYLRDNHPTQMYGMKNAKEMIAEGLANPKFQQYLNGIPIPNQPKATLWTLFKTLVSKLVGNFIKPDTALTKLLNDAEALFGKERGYNYSVSIDAQEIRPPSSAILGVKDGARTWIAYAKSKTDPNTKYTLYPVNSQNLRGDPVGKVEGLTREQVERRITEAGSQTIAPATDTSVKSGTPKNTATMRVGYDTNGQLQSIAYQQKDGTWTYYESDADVRADPRARITKGLSTSTVERYITGRGLAAQPPTGGAVQPAGSAPTNVGYKVASWLRRTFQDDEAALANMGGDIDALATTRNSRYQKKWRDNKREYVEPARAAGESISRRFAKKETDIMSLMQDLHVVERMANKSRQFYRGNLLPDAMQVKQQDLLDKQNAAQERVNAARASNPEYVKAVEQELAPKLKAMANHTIDMNAAYGFITTQEAQNIKDAYDFYVPLQKDDKRTTIGKAATGASTSGDLTFQRMQEQMQRTVARGEQNVIRDAVLKLVEKDVLRAIRKTGSLFGKKTITEETPAIIAGRDKIFYDPASNSLNEGKESFTFDRDAVDVYRNGERIRMKIVEPSLLEALHPFKGEQRSTAVTVLLGTLARINRLVSIGKTSLNPAWWPFNFVRDVLTSNLNLPAGVSRAAYMRELARPSNYASVFWNVAKEAIGKDPAGGYADAKDAGAFISHRAFIGLDQIAHDTDAMFRPSTVQKAKAAGSRAFDMLSILAQTAESVPRMAMYKAALKAYNGNKDKAATAAKNASVNFEKRGRVNLSNYWIFGNAKMQGIHALVKTAERQGVLKSAIGASALVGLGAAAAALGYEWSEKDKDGKSKYTKVPDFKKDSLLLFKADAPGVPIPQEISPLYVLGNAVAEASMGGTTYSKAAARVFTSFLNNIHPGSVPQQDPIGHKANVMDFMMRMMLPSQVAPLYDTATNTNTFGRPIVSRKDERKAQGIPLSEMGSPTEDQLAVNAAKGLYEATDGSIDIAPQQLKLWHNYFDPLTEGYGFVRDLFGGRDPKYVGDVVNPLERKFTGAATEFYDQEQFDELLAKAKHAKYQAEHGAGGINALSPEDQVLARSAGMLQKVESDGNNLFKGQKLLTPERRKLLNERKRDLVLGGISRYNDARNQAGLR